MAEAIASVILRNALPQHPAIAVIARLFHQAVEIGDGDVALELAAVWMPDEASRVQLITAYARNANINVLTLARQVARWRPWVLMLMAGWFEMRLQQTDDEQFIALANDAWRQLQTKG